MSERTGQEKARSELRRRNLRRLRRKEYGENWLALRKEVKRTCGENIARSLADAKSKKQNFTAELAAKIEKGLSLPEGYFSTERPPKSPAYVFIQCDGKAANSLFKKLQNHAIVDEVAIIVGDADLFLRIYGTQEEFKEFLTSELYALSKGKIHRTNTHFSFEESYHRRPL